MEKTKLMLEYERETREILDMSVLSGDASGSWYGFLDMMDEKATAYDRLMSGGKFTMKEMANIKKHPVTIDKDGTINAHGAIPHLARGGFVGFTDCWVNDADDYAEIDESFVEIPEGLDWTYSLTLPDGWEATDDYS